MKFAYKLLIAVLIAELTHFYIFKKSCILEVLRRVDRPKRTRMADSNKNANPNMPPPSVRYSR